MGTVHHLIRILGSGGESAAADLAARLGDKAEAARELAYRLYVIAERKKRASESLAYNGLVQSWPEIIIIRFFRHTPTACTGRSVPLVSAWSNQSSTFLVEDPQCHCGDQAGQEET